jgi:hypothetical protein
MRAQAKGFVLRFAPPAFGDKAAPLDAHASTREGRADGEQLRLVVRPQATTLEAEREQHRSSRRSSFSPTADASITAKKSRTASGGRDSSGRRIVCCSRKRTRPGVSNYPQK